MDRTEILEEATAQVVLNYFKLRYPELDPKDSKLRMDGCISDVTFIINNFMRISADLAKKEAEKEVE